MQPFKTVLHVTLTRGEGIWFNLDSILLLSQINSMGIYKKILMVCISALARVSENVSHLLALISATVTLVMLINDRGDFHVILFSGITLAAEILSTVSGFARRYLDRLERGVVKQDLDEIRSQMRELQEYTKARVITDEAKAILVERLKGSAKRPYIYFSYDSAFDSASTAHMLRKIFIECEWKAFDQGQLISGHSEVRDIFISVNYQNRDFAETLTNWLNEAGFPSVWQAYMQEPSIGHVNVIIYRTSNKLGS